MMNRTLIATVFRRLWFRPGRKADTHMWRLNENATARVQAFRDENGKGLALITLRDGDGGASHINNAGRYRKSVWKEFFPKDPAPPTLIVNLLNPTLRFKHGPSVVEIEFDSEGRFRRTSVVNSEDLTTLDRLGAEWDEGTGFIPYTPPPPTTAVVLRRIAVSELPKSDLFRDMDSYVVVDWAEATTIALRAGVQQNIPRGLPPAMRKAVYSLFDDSLSLIREPGKEVRWMNGQHRAEAMRRQGAVETIVEEQRPIDAYPLPGELRQIHAF